MLSPKSTYILNKAHPDLQKVFQQVAEKTSIEIVCSLRGEQEQEQAFREGHSKAHFGQSPHNHTPALAVDVVPLPERYSNEQKLIDLSIPICQAANELEIPITWGGEFSGDYGFKHNGDLPHYQLKNWLKLRRE